MLQGINYADPAVWPNKSSYDAWMQEALQEARAIRKAKKDREARQDTSFRDYVSLANPRYRWHTAVSRLGDVLQRVSDGELKRVMIFMHPRSGKSEVVSRLFSSYYLYRHPEQWVGINSYGASLALSLSRKARENYKRAGGETKHDADAVSLWETHEDGGMWSAGVGGPILGKGFRLGIIDDPIKNAEEANSETIQEKQRDWYDSTFSTRMEPDAAVVLIMQRWNDNDLAGYLLSKEDLEPENWHIVHLEAVKEEEPPKYPQSCTLEPDWRKEGEPLIPERFPLDVLNKISGRIGVYFWNALYQQRPRAREGGMFKRDWFEIVPNFPRAGAQLCRYWDKAGSKNKGSAYTAGVLLANAAGAFYVVDVLMGKWRADERERIIKQTAQADRAAFPGNILYIGVEQEGGSGGLESADNTIINLAGFSAFKDRPMGDKVLRAEPVASQASAHNIKIVAGDWNTNFLNILTSFPTGAIKDPVDALSGAFAKLAVLSTWDDVQELGAIENYQSPWG